MHQSRFIFNPKYQPRDHKYVDNGSGACAVCVSKKGEHHEEYLTHPSYTGFGCVYCGRAADEHLVQQEKEQCQS